MMISLEDLAVRRDGTFQIEGNLLSHSKIV